ncbi:LysR family transcriptional regulator [Telluria sp. Tellsp104]
MRFNKLDLNLLVALDAMLDERNISRAAARMYMSQSAMSNALARLRLYFEDELLVQVGRRMELTPRAEGLKDIVRDVLVRVDAGILTSPSFDFTHSERVFSMSVSDFTLQTLMPYVTALASRQAPGVRLDLLPQFDVPERALERGEVDLLVIPEPYCSPSHPTELLFEEDLSCVVWSGGRLAGAPLTIDDFKSAGHVVVVLHGEQAFDPVLVEKYGIVRRVEATTFHFASASSLVVETDRIATVHASLARQAAKFLPVTVHPFPLAMPRMRQTAQWHKYRSYDPGLQWLRGLLHEAAGRMATNPII